MNRSVSALLLVLSLLLGVPGMVRADAGAYLPMLESADVQSRIRATKLIIDDRAFDQVLLDKIETALRAGYQVRTRDRHHYDEMAYYCKALGASGLMKYQDLLTEVEKNTPNRNLVRHAGNALKLLADNAERSRLKASREGWDKSLSDKENEQLQMLRSDQYRLKRTAARQIYDRPGANPKLYAEVARQLLDGVAAPQKDRDYMDTMAWLCKALGSSGDKQYKETLGKVIAETRDRKLKKYADQAFRML